MALKYNLTSGAAATKLGISQKTVIRWAQQGRLSYTDVRGTKSGKYRFASSEVEKMIKENNLIEDKQSTTISTSITPSPNTSISHHSENKIFKMLYEKTAIELSNKQNKLEGVNYRLGQLETQLKNTVPLLDYSSKVNEVMEDKDSLIRQVRSMEKRLDVEKRLNWIFLSLLCVFVAEIVFFFALK